MKRKIPLPKSNPIQLKILDDVLATLKQGRTFCLSGHQNPDPDVVGSELALASLIRRLRSQNRIVILNKGAVPQSVLFLKGASSIKNTDRVKGVFDVLVVFECSGADRMGDIIDFKTQAKKVVNIDHHLHNPFFGHVNFVEPHTSSTAELIFKIFERAEMPLHVDEATALYTGLVTDTGWFRYGNTNSQTHTIASKLLGKGVPVAELSERIYMSRSLPSVRLQAWVLSQMKLYFEDRVAVLRVPKKIMKDFKATADDLDELVNQGLQIKSVCSSILLKEKANPNSVKVSLRSKNLYNINQVARLFGGGGHKNASGCTLNMSLENAEKRILKEVKRIFSKS